MHSPAYKIITDTKSDLLTVLNDAKVPGAPLCRKNAILNYTLNESMKCFESYFRDLNQNHIDLLFYSKGVSVKNQFLYFHKYLKKIYFKILHAQHGNPPDMEDATHGKIENRLQWHTLMSQDILVMSSKKAFVSKRKSIALSLSTSLSMMNLNPRDMKKVEYYLGLMQIFPKSFLSWRSVISHGIEKQQGDPDRVSKSPYFFIQDSRNLLTHTSKTVPCTLDDCENHLFKAHPCGLNLFDFYEKFDEEIFAFLSNRIMYP